MRRLSEMRFVSLLLTLSLLFTMTVPAMVLAAPLTVPLGSTVSYAVLAGSGITNTGPTTINGDAGGDVGVFPNNVFVGAASVSMSGTVHLADAAALAAQNDLTTAYTNAAGRAFDVDLTGLDLGGLTLTPGVYSFDSSAQLTGTLILDGQNATNPVFIFQIGSTLTTAAGSNVSLINGARYCRTFWQVGSSATLGTGSHFVGHIFALTSITATTGTTVQGQLLARNGAVTLDTNTITNGFSADPSTAATLHVIKHVINDDGGSAVAANFNQHVKAAGIDVAGSPAAGVESPGTTYTLAAGTYAISEDAYAGYTVSYSGDSDGSGNITLAPCDNKTVTITNDDIPATLHIIKHVVNNSGRSAVAADFNLHVKAAGIDVAGSPALGVELPGTTYTLAAGTYAISEDYHSGYSVSYSGDSDGSGNITLSPGDIKTVTITNNDIAIAVVSPPTIYPPLINVIKTPRPLALTSGPGEVNYTYQVTNPGMVALSNVTVTDDKISLVSYVSGDLNSDDLLQTNETWVYTGKMNLTETTTNTATAKGSANGMTATDIAIATVILTPLPEIYPPLINVIKTADPLTLTSGPGLVTYTYKVTNPGVVALSDVTVTDDKISLVSYVSGDVNIDRLLQPSETWVYTGKMNLTTTTVNTATAKGSANGMTATDIAYATVFVTPPVVVTETVTGGQIPNTATPLHELFLIGAALTLVGALGWKSRKRFE